MTDIGVGSRVVVRADAPQALRERVSRHVGVVVAEHGPDKLVVVFADLDFTVILKWESLEPAGMPVKTHYVVVDSGVMLERGDVIVARQTPDRMLTVDAPVTVVDIEFSYWEAPNGEYVRRAVVVDDGEIRRSYELGHQFVVRREVSQ